MRCLRLFRGDVGGGGVSLWLVTLSTVDVVMRSGEDVSCVEESSGDDASCERGEQYGYGSRSVTGDPSSAQTGLVSPYDMCVPGGAGDASAGVVGGFLSATGVFGVFIIVDNECNERQGI